MARTVTVKLNGTEWQMPASYKASREIAESVGDPLKMAIAAQSGELEWTTEDIVSVIYIGCKNAGCGLSRNDLGELIFAEGGPGAYLEQVGTYIGALVLGGPDKPIAQGQAKKKPVRGSKS